MVQGGDFINGDGTGSATIYGTREFRDEGEGLRGEMGRHSEGGVLSMAVSFFFFFAVLSFFFFFSVWCLGCEEEGL